MITSTELVTLKMDAIKHADAVYQSLGELTCALRSVPAEKFFSPRYESGINKSPEEARSAVLRAYRHIFYEDDQKPNESMFFVGAVIAPPSLIPTVKKVNEAKTRFYEFLASIRELTIAGVDGFPEPVTSRIFENSEYARLHRLQATRQIHILEPQPEVVSFTLRTSPQIVKRTRDQVLRMLHNNDQGTAEDRYAKGVIFGLPEDEILAWRKPVPPKPRANVRDENGKYMTNAVLPLFIVDDGHQTVIKSNPLRPQPVNPQGGQQGHRRRAMKLMDKPVIQHPEIYRYRESVQREQTHELKASLSGQTLSRSSGSLHADPPLT